MQRLCFGVLVATLAAAPPLAAQQAPQDDWPTLTVRLERAATTGSVTGLRAVRAELLRTLAQSPARPRAALAQYAIAFIAWRMAFLPDAPEHERNDLLEDAVTRLAALVKVDPRDAEAHALLGGVYGSQIGLSPSKGMLLGGRASGALDRAAELNANSPRVPLLQGISAFNTPATFGGGDDKAERLLRRSAQLFARESTDRVWPNWGRADVHAWLGQLMLRKGDRAGARAEYDKALAIAPEFGWVKYALLPALDRGAKP